jgi:membrane protease YdiL (CAAX protease family)
MVRGPFATVLVPAPSPLSSPEFVVTPLLVALFVVEMILILAGLFFLLRTPRQIGLRLLGLAPARLTASPFRISEIFLAGAFAFGGAIILQVVFISIGRRYCPPPVDGGMGTFHVLVAAGFQLGLVAGLAHAWFWHLRPSRRSPALSPAEPVPETGSAFRPVLRDGTGAFVIALPVVWLVSFLWQNTLALFGIEAPPQDIVLLFARSGDWLSLGAMIIFAVLVAPVAEELLFRVGLFRWLRGRVVRTLALLVPAIAFSMLHASLAVLGPLVALSVVFSLAYERSGRAGVPILAHALFNLNTIILVLAGFPTSEQELDSALRQILSLLN